MSLNDVYGIPLVERYTPAFVQTFNADMKQERHKNDVMKALIFPLRAHFLTAV